jgi:hypothetical protein
MCFGSVRRAASILIGPIALSIVGALVFLMP